MRVFGWASAVRLVRLSPSAVPFLPAATSLATVSAPVLSVRGPLRRYASSSETPNAPARSIANLLRWKPEGQVPNIVVNGFVRSVRTMKLRSFIALGDGSSLAPAQVLVPTELVEGLSIGVAVRLTGSWVISKGAGQSHELHAHQVEILGPSDPETYPIQKKYQTPEYLRTMPHLRPRTAFNSLLLRLRSDAIATLTQFFAGREFVQTHPPVITSSDCEGGGDVFLVAHDHPKEDQTSVPFFQSPKYLTVSAQLHLEALAQAVGNVWTLSPAFRAEKSDTSRHLSEFYMLEAEMSFVDHLDAVMDLLEDMLRYLTTILYDSQVAQEIRKPGRERGASESAGDRLSPEEVNARWQGLMQAAWPRLTYTDAVNMLKDAHIFEDPPCWGHGFKPEQERYLAGTVGRGQPVFVTKYPRDLKPFYMRATSGLQLSDHDTVECFDLLVPDNGEIAGGSLREHRLSHLVEAMRKRKMDTPSLDRPITSSPGHDDVTQPKGNLDWYVDLRRWGCPPHGGFGLGLDRLLAYLSGVQSIRDTVTFPRWHGRCDC